jgi:hypothetical protein
MFCHACGQPFDPDGRWCSHCGTGRTGVTAQGQTPPPPAPPPAPPTVHRGNTNWYLRSAGLLLLLVAVAIIVRLGDAKKGEQTAVQPPTSEPAKSGAVDASAEIQNDAMKAARAKYVDKMQDEFRNEGVDATISDSDGELIIVSDALNLKPNRDQFMRTTLDAAYRRNLCVAGFRTVKLTSGVLFGDGDTYSMGCPESKEERQARLGALKGQRQQFVEQLQNSFSSDPEVAALGIRVEQAVDELIMTAPSSANVSPKLLRSVVSSEFGDGSSNKLCGVGFHGLRVRSSPSSNGTFISFDCGKTNH